MNFLKRRLFQGILVVFVLATLISCTSIKVNTIPEPPPTAKLRVYVVSFSHGFNDWKTSDAKFAENQTRYVEHFLEKGGIYEVVNTREVQAAIGDQWLSYSAMKKSDWAQARQIGNALYADFIFIVTRDVVQEPTGSREHVRSFIITTELINVKTGESYRVQKSLGGLTYREEDWEPVKRLVKENNRDLFNQAKHNMLSVAIRKGRIFTSPSPPEVHNSTEQTPTGAHVVSAKETSPAATQKPKSPPEMKQQTPSVTKEKNLPIVAKTAPTSPNLPGSGLTRGPTKGTGAKKLVVYDFDASDQYRTVALILAEVLREEVFKLKQYVLVNREDLQNVLAEMALQQTGLIDEKDAVLTGKGLAADQVVTGRLGQLGKLFLIQAKRVDVQTLSTLGLASLKFTEGHEDELLNKFSDFTKTLVGIE